MAAEISSARASDSFKRQLGERRACQQCSVAKAKCIFKDELSICERCDRLKKPCSHQPLNPVKKGRVTKKSSRNAQLEQKLDSIVSLISKQPQSIQQPEQHRKLADPIATGGQAPFTGSFNYPYTSLPSPTSDQHVPERHPKQTTRLPDAASAPALLPEVPSPVLSMDHEEAKALFNSWRKSLTDYHPFVIIPDHVTFDSALKERPFLTASMICGALWGDLARQIDFAQKTLAYLVTNLLLKGHKTLDMLQALLVLFSWYVFHIIKNPQATSIVHLAIGVVIDLGLNRLYDRNAEPRMQLFAVRRPSRVQHQPETQQHTLEERRTLCGAYYLTSCVSVAFGKFEPLRWTRNMDESCAVLESEGDLPSDVYLVWLVRTQRLVERSKESFCNHDFIVVNPYSSSVTALIRSWQADMKQHWDSIPVDLQKNRNLGMVYHFAHIQLYDEALELIPAQDPSNPTTSLQQLNRRIELVQGLYDSLRSYYELLFSLEPFELHRLAFDGLAKTSNTIIILYRLTKASDCKLISDALDNPLSLIDVIDQFTSVFVEAAAAARAAGHPLGDRHLFTRWIWRMTRFRRLQLGGDEEEPQGNCAEIVQAERGGYVPSEPVVLYPTPSTQPAATPVSTEYDNAEGGLGTSLMEFEDFNWANDHWEGNPGMSQCPMS